MTDQTANDSLNTYNHIYTTTHANNTFRIARGMVAHLAAKRTDLTHLQQDRLVTKIMNAITDAALEMVNHEPCKGATVRLVHLLAAWDMLDPHLYQYIYNHLDKFVNVAHKSKAMYTAFNTTWKVLSELAPLKKHLQRLHAVLAEENSVRTAVSLLFVEAAQETLKAIGEMMRPNLSHMEIDTVSRKTQIAAKRITDDLHFLNID